MNFLKSILNKAISEIDVWFFYGFLLTFTLSIRKVLFYFPIEGIFNEYSGIYLYVSDVFFILTLLFWQIYILCNINITLSSIKLWISEFFHNLYLFLPFILVAWSFLSIVWSENEAIALFRSFKLLELYFIYLYLIFRIVPRGTICQDKVTNCSTWNNLFLIIISLGFTQSFLGILQFIRQKSIGLYFLKESLIGPDIPGVAKIILDGHRYIRPYGLFPHPNILGGFLMFSLIFTLLCLRLFHVEQFKDIKVKKIFIKTILLVQVIGLILTFSKSAILGLIVGLGYAYWKINVPRETLSPIEKSKLSKIRHVTKQLFHVEQLRIFIPTTLIILVGLLFIFKPDLNSLLVQSLDERILYLNVSRGTILENPIFGLGLGQFVLSMQKFSPIILQSWQYQPVHNVFLLIWSELGLVGLVLFVWILRLIFFTKTFSRESYQYTKHVPRGTIFLKALLLGLIFISFFDHYLWSIQQGEFLLWMTLGIIAGVALDQAKRKDTLST